MRQARSRMCESIKGKRPPKSKGPHRRNKETMKHHETRARGMPMHAHAMRAAASTPRYKQPTANKPPPRAPRRRPTAHVCILYSLHSRPPARKEAWYEGHPHVTERREPHVTRERTTATTNTHTTNPRAHEEQEVCPHTQGSDKRRKGQKVWLNKKKEKKVHSKGRR